MSSLLLLDLFSLQHLLLIEPQCGFSWAHLRVVADFCDSLCYCFAVHALPPVVLALLPLHLLFESVVFDLLICEELDLEAGRLQLFGRSLLFQEKFLDPIVHLVQFEVAVSADLARLVKRQPCQKLPIVFAFAWGYDASLA